MPESKPIIEKTVREKDLLLPRISKIVDKLIQDNEVSTKQANPKLWSPYQI
jgi:hypothetical protein